MYVLLAQSTKPLVDDFISFILFFESFIEKSYGLTVIHRLLTIIVRPNLPLMNNLAPRIAFLLIVLGSFSQSFSQVGIGTTEPQAMLDVNGSFRVTGIKSSYSDINAVRILGVDEDGNFVEVEVDENLILENNKIRANNKVSRLGDIPTLNISVANNLNLIILPGEPNDDKRVIRIINTAGDLDITGIEAGVDGQTIWLYPQSGRIRLMRGNASSLPANQIQGTGNWNIFQYEMVELMYDATLAKWIIMDN